MAGLFGGVRMSAGYARQSRSQASIGARLAAILKRHVSGGGEAVDLGCGPGNVTALLQRVLGARWRVHGLDADVSAIRRARKAHRGVTFSVGSFYGEPSRRFDAAFSNEAWHWMPALPARFYREPGTHYYWFSPSGRGAFRRWAAGRRLRAFRFLARSLAPGGVAVLQFGLDGQLRKTHGALNRSVGGARKVKFPTYYGTAAEAVRLARRAGLRVRERTTLVEDLKERTSAEIAAFVRGYAEPRLEAALGKRRAREIFAELEKGLRPGAREKEWRRLILVLERPT